MGLLTTLQFPSFYPRLKAKLSSHWKAQAVWAKFDKRAGHKVYKSGRVCAGQRVLVIGAGPCGLRTAIEAQLLGARVGYHLLRTIFVYLHRYFRPVS